MILESPPQFRPRSGSRLEDLLEQPGLHGLRLCDVPPLPSVVPILVPTARFSSTWIGAPDPGDERA